MNKIFLIGNLTKDPELSETSSGVAVCRFSIAVNRRYTTANGERETDFFNVTAWRGLAETVAKYCKKGQKVAVIGTIQIRQYEANDGTKRMSVDVVVDEVEFLASKSVGVDSGDNDGNSGNGGNSSRAGNAARTRRPQLETLDDDSDIPF